MSTDHPQTPIGSDNSSSSSNTTTTAKVEQQITILEGIPINRHKFHAMLVGLFGDNFGVVVSCN